MSTRRRYTYLVLAAALLTCAFVVSPPREATAMPEFQILCIYYSDAAHTTVVGNRFISCTGISNSGIQTAFVNCVQLNRCYTPGPECSDAPWCDPNHQVCC